MNNYIIKYKEIMKKTGKKLETIIAEKISDNVFDTQRYVLLSTTKEAWIIHPIYINQNNELNTGNGSYLSKDLYDYEQIKDIFYKIRDEENDHFSKNNFI